MRGLSFAFGFFGVFFGDGGAFNAGAKVAGGGVDKMELGSRVAGLISGAESAVVTAGEALSTGGVTGDEGLASETLTRGVTLGGR